MAEAKSQWQGSAATPEVTTSANFRPTYTGVYCWLSEKRLFSVSCMSRGAIWLSVDRQHGVAFHDQSSRNGGWPALGCCRLSSALQSYMPWYCLVKSQSPRPALPQTTSGRGPVRVYGTTDVLFCTHVFPHHTLRRAVLVALSPAPSVPVPAEASVMCEVQLWMVRIQAVGPVRAPAC